MDRFVDVPRPARQDGVASALRRSFSPPVEDLPQDMQALLDRL